MNQSLECTNGASLKSQVLELKDEVKKLTQKLDNFLDAVSRNKQDFGCQFVPLLSNSACQSTPSLNSFGTQTESDSKIVPITPNQSENIDLENILLSESICNTSFINSDAQDDVLLDIFLKSNVNDVPAVQSNIYNAIPLVKIPFVHIPS